MQAREVQLIGESLITQVDDRAPAPLSGAVMHQVSEEAGPGAGHEADLAVGLLDEIAEAKESRGGRQERDQQLEQKVLASAEHVVEGLAREQQIEVPAPATKLVGRRDQDLDLKFAVASFLSEAAGLVDHMEAGEQACGRPSGGELLVS